MKIKYLLSVIAIVAITKDGFAQYSQDAIRFSTFQTGSTSRIKAIGNAGTAIGGDLSSISGNPAGLGFFTHSELSITPEYDASKVNSLYLNTKGNASKNSVNLSNAAVVFYQQLATAKGRDKTKGWLSINYGASYARTNNFYENVNYSGKNPGSSITDYYAGLGNTSIAQYGNLNINSLDGWAYRQKLIDNYGTDATPDYRSTVSVPVDQLSRAFRTGGQSELDFAFGANYSNKLYLGLGVAITDIRYNSFSQFTENGNASMTTDPTHPTTGVPTDFNSTYSQDQVTRGSGANVKLGVIYKPINALRLGFTFTSPTFYSIDDSYNEGIATNTAGTGTLVNNSGDYNLTYTMRTPLKLAGGAAVFIGKIGFISGDVEYIDYTTTHISNNDSYNGDFDNGNIKDLYRSAVNVHVGAEARLNSIVYLRGGYSLQGSPLKDNGSNLKTWTGGVGFRFGDYYVDATYVHLKGFQTVYPYEIGTLTPAASLRKINDNAFLTLGYRF